MTRPKVAVFDSGVGGLTIFSEISQQVTGIDLYYCSDSAHYPYGPKPSEEVIAYSEKTASKLFQKISFDLLVVACNTASTVALPRLREIYKEHVVGVVPAVKPAAKVTKTKHIGLLATPGTVSRPYTDQLIKDFAGDCRITKVGSRLLVDLAEDKLRGKPIDDESIKSEIALLIDQQSIDTIVLACTHFPLLKEELKANFDRPINWIDSGEAIAKRVASLLPNRDHSLAQVCQGFFTSDSPSSKDLIMALKLQFLISEVEILA